MFVVHYLTTVTISLILNFVQSKFHNVYMIFHQKVANSQELTTTFLIKI